MSPDPWWGLCFAQKPQFHGMTWFWILRNKVYGGQNAFYECLAVVTKKKTLKFVMKCNDIDVWRTDPSPGSICNSNCHELITFHRHWVLFIRECQCCYHIFFLALSKYLTPNTVHMIHVTMILWGLTCPSYEPMPQGSCLYTISNPVATVVAELASTLAVAPPSVNTSKRNGVWNAAITEESYGQCQVIAQ